MDPREDSPDRPDEQAAPGTPAKQAAPAEPGTPAEQAAPDTPAGGPPRRSFLRKLIVKLSIAASALFALYWAAAALVHYEAIVLACGCG